MIYYHIIILLLIVFVLKLDAGKVNKKEILKGDLPFISCAVCNRVVHEAYALVDKKRNEKLKKFEEDDIVEILDQICRPELKAGTWIRYLDIEEKKDAGGTFIVLDEPGGASKCEQECSTIANSCETLMDEDLDRDLISSELWKNKLTLEELKDKTCKVWSKRCKKIRKPVSTSKSKRRKNYEFEYMTDKDLQMEQLMAEMKNSGLGGMNMMDKDGMKDKMDQYSDEYSDEDENDPYNNMYGESGQDSMDGIGEF